MFIIFFLLSILMFHRDDISSNFLADLLFLNLDGDVYIMMRKQRWKTRCHVNAVANMLYATLIHTNLFRLI